MNPIQVLFFISYIKRTVYHNHRILTKQKRENKVYFVKNHNSSFSSKHRVKTGASMKMSSIYLVSRLPDQASPNMTPYRRFHG